MKRPFQLAYLLCLLFLLLDYSIPARGAADPGPGVGYVLCAAENGTCTATATGNLVFGAAGKFSAAKHVLAASVTPCNLATFPPDPIYGTVKNCWLLPDPVVVTQPYPTTIGWFPPAPPGSPPLVQPAGAALLNPIPLIPVGMCTQAAQIRMWQATDLAFIWYGTCQHTRNSTLSWIIRQVPITGVVLEDPNLIWPATPTTPTVSK